MFNSMGKSSFVRIKSFELCKANLKFQNKYFDKKKLLIKLLKEMYPNLLDKYDFFSK